MPNTGRQTLLTAFSQASGRSASGQSPTTDQGFIDALGHAAQAVNDPTPASAETPTAIDALGQVVGAPTLETGTNTSQQTLLTAFGQASGRPASGQPSTADQGLVDALGQATQVVDALTQATGANTDALAQNSQTKSSSGGGAVSDVLGTASQFLDGGLSLMSLLSLFSGLLGGGQSQQPSLAPFSLPPSLNLESTSNNQDLIWGENGLPRSAGGGGGASAPTQITVQVQAMDSQSFLDHSDDIARAVRQAMLNMNSINDVVTSL